MFLTKNLFQKYFGAIPKKQGFLPQDYFNEEKGFQRWFVKAVKMRVYFIDKVLSRVISPARKPCPVLWWPLSFVCIQLLNKDSKFSFSSPAKYISAGVIVAPARVVPFAPYDSTWVTISQPLCYYISSLASTAFCAAICGEILWNDFSSSVYEWGGKGNSVPIMLPCFCFVQHRRRPNSLNSIRGIIE